LETRKLRSEKVLIVGDNPDSEIEAGNRLGIKTVQILRPGVPRADNASYHIQTFHQLKMLLEGNESMMACSPRLCEVRRAARINQLLE
jgi:FMN phosphatase YigB (HAD superfamily)